MKYVVLQTPDGRKLPIIFPDCLVHAHVAGAMQQVIAASQAGSDQLFNERQLEARLQEAKYTDHGSPPVSAGFVEIKDARCHGKSESLGNLESSPSDTGRVVLGHTVLSMDDMFVMATFDRLFGDKEGSVETVGSIMGR